MPYDPNKHARRQAQDIAAFLKEARWVTLEKQGLFIEIHHDANEDAHGTLRVTYPRDGDWIPVSARTSTFLHIDAQGQTHPYVRLALHVRVRDHSRLPVLVLAGDSPRCAVL